MSGLQPESVWDYPRPPRIERFEGHIRIVQRDIILVDTNKPWRMLETSHPPTYYLPTEGIQMHLLKPNDYQTYCEFKGKASYFDLLIEGENPVRNVAWCYPSPTKRYAELAGLLAFHAALVDKCYVCDELVTPQEGGFYGGWITSNLKGPFKGGKGTFGW